MVFCFSINIMTLTFQYHICNQIVILYVVVNGFKSTMRYDSIGRSSPAIGNQPIKSPFRFIFLYYLNGFPPLSF